MGGPRNAYEYTFKNDLSLYHIIFTSFTYQNSFLVKGHQLERDIEASLQYNANNKSIVLPEIECHRALKFMRPQL